MANVIRTWFFCFNMNKSKTIGIYCRISRLKEEGKDKSINDQKLLGIEFANRHGYKYELYIDEGLSAASDDINDRPAFKRLLEDMESGHLYGIFAYDQSRFNRNQQVHLAFISIVKKYVELYYTEVDGRIDLNNPQAEFMSNLMSVINQYHVTLTKHKVKSVLKRNANDGKPHGIRAYGYTHDENGYFVIDEQEALIVKRIFDLTISGIGTRAIANAFNDEGIPTRYNKIGKGVIRVKNKYTGEITQQLKADVKWNPNTIRGMLRNSTYKGEKIYNGEVIKSPAIIDKKTWDMVQSILTNRVNKKKETYDYLLKGKLRCGTCGRNYYGRTRQDKKDHAYICSSRRMKDGNCGNRGINIDKLDDLVWYRIINSPLFLKLLKRDFSFDENKTSNLEVRMNELNGRLGYVESRRQKLISAFTNGVFDESDLQTQIKLLNDERDIINNELEPIQSRFNAFENASKIISTYENFQAKLNHFRDKLTFEEKRNIVNLFIENIAINYNDEGEYNLDIMYCIHPSEFDTDYPKHYGSGDEVILPKKEVTPHLTPITSVIQFNGAEALKYLVTVCISSDWKKEEFSY
jgi:site-specific DNA recombinase